MRRALLQVVPDTSCGVSDGWLVCEYPERPVDRAARWHIFGRCRGCVIAMEARLARGEESRPTIARIVLETDEELRA